MIKQLSLIFGSKTKAQEMVLLLHNVKHVIRQGFYEEELPKVEKFCDKNNLVLVKSRFKVLLADETAYSNKGIRLREDDSRRGMYFVYISQDEEQALLASYYEMMNDHRALGLRLGYPQCCVDFFCRSFSEKSNNLELMPINLWTNLTKREDDCVLLSHFPCSSYCSKSIALAQKYYEVIRKVDMARAEEIMNSLSTK